MPALHGRDLTQDRRGLVVATVAGEDLVAKPLGFVDVACVQESGGLGERGWYLKCSIDPGLCSDQYGQVVGYAVSTVSEPGSAAPAAGGGTVFDGLGEPAESR